jgi:hypothetical protein
MKTSITAAIREAARLGFPCLSYKRETRKVPGEPRSMRWYTVKLACPCGRVKSVCVSEDSLGGFRESLIEHLKLDGLWNHDEETCHARAA